MTLLHISDIHVSHRDLIEQEADVLVISGDLSKKGTFEEINDVLLWVSRYPCTTKIVVPGNHDRWAFDNQTLFKKMCCDLNIHLLVDETICLHGLTFHGMPWITYKAEWNWPLNDSAWAVTPNEQEVTLAVSKIPLQTQILITHAPPQGIGDIVSKGTYFAQMNETHPGCPHLRRFVDTSQNLLLCLFGHVHETVGIQQYQSGWFSNAARGVNRIIIRDELVVNAEILQVL